MYYEMLGKKIMHFCIFFFLQRMKICATSCLKFQGKQETGKKRNRKLQLQVTVLTVVTAFLKRRGGKK